MTTDDPARDIARIVANLLGDELVGEHVGDCLVEAVQIYGMASVQVELDDGRTFLVEVEEGPLA
jgi:hypothetical protein